MGSFIHQQPHFDRQTAQTRSSLLVWGVAVLILLPGTALGDFYELLLESPGSGSTAPEVVVFRQTPDLTSGFDLFLIEIWRMGDSSPRESFPLARKSVDALARHGHLELYHRNVSEERLTHLEKLARRGFAPISAVHPARGSNGDSLRLCTDSHCLELLLVRTLGPQSLTLSFKEESTLLHRFPGASANPRSSSPQVIAVRSLKSVAVVGRRGNQGLVAVVKTVSAPHSGLVSEDEILWLPLRRPLRRIQVPFPLGNIVPEPRDEGSTP